MGIGMLFCIMAEELPISLVVMALNILPQTDVGGESKLPWGCRRRAGG